MIKKSTIARPNDESFKTIFELVPSVIYELSPNGKLTALSPSFEKVTGWKAKEWIGKDFSGLVHPDDLELARKSFKDGISGKTHLTQTELRILSKDGSYRICEFISKPKFRNGVIAGRMGIGRDVTESRNFQKRMAAQYLTSQILAEAESIEGSVERIMGVLGETFGWDISIYWEFIEQKNILAVNKVWSKLGDVDKDFVMQYKKHFRVGEGFVGRIVKTGMPLWSREILKTPYYLRKNMARKLKLNSVFGFPVKLGDKVIAVIEFYSSDKRKPDENVEKIVNSVSYQIGQFVRQKEYEEEKERSAKQMDAIFNSVPNGITVEKKNGEIIYANPRAAEMLGYKSIKDLYKTNINTAFSKFEITDKAGKLVESDQMPAARVIRDNKEQIQTLHFKNRKTSFERWYNIKATKMEDTPNLAVVKVFNDVTKQMEEQKERELFIGFVSHEFRGPLASIKAYVQLLSRRIKAKNYEQALEYLDSVDGQTDRLVNLINNWLDATKVRAGLLKLNIKEVDYGKLVDGIINDFRITTNGKIIILKETVKIKMYIDPDRTSQVLNNLLSNAVKHSKKGGKIEVTVKKVKGFIVTSVCDHGNGIPKNFQKEMFKLFKKADGANNRSGMGMGLFISNAIVKAHGGKMWVDSKPKKGSTFYYELPV